MKSLGNFFCFTRFFAIILVVFCLSFLLQTQCQSEVLQGNVEEDSTLTRLGRPNFNSGNGQADSLKINRPADNSLNGLVNTSQFSGAANSANLNGQTSSLGLVQPDKFQNLSADKFDLGADRGSRELLIGWEKWYKQLSGAIYSRWSQVANIPGHAVVRLIVTNQRQLTAILVRSSGSRAFDQDLLSAIRSLDGNPGLTFPAQSQRTEVSLESDYIAGTDIQPGYNWIRNDYEKVDESY